MNSGVWQGTSTAPTHAELTTGEVAQMTAVVGCAFVFVLMVMCLVYDVYANWRERRSKQQHLTEIALDLIAKYGNGSYKPMNGPVVGCPGCGTPIRSERGSRFACPLCSTRIDVNLELRKSVAKSFKVIRGGRC